ncbi:hypothetical protein VNI00_018399 [Paramarasmius palmivorus]|uniref:GST N-terminal domain-containing protein n=1 Tax=Paramarasmius palmivorus TaxID=297713 RepID=A0AAW0AWN8_9AGAR
MITLYDVGPAPNSSEISLSPHVRKARYILNYKRIPYKVSWVTFFTLEETAKSLGAAPTGVRADGSIRYTVPFIVDSSNGAVVSDSYRIAEYLDRTYPDTPRLVPGGTEGLQWAWGDTIPMRIIPLLGGLARPLIEKANGKEVMKGVDKAYGPPGPPMSEEEKKKAWGVVKATLDDISKYYPEGQVFLTGDKPIYADFSFIPVFWSVKTLFGSESEEWKEMAGWNGGRWGRMLDKVQYESMEVV